MKKATLLLTLVLIASLLAGCAGTPVVYYTNCTCPAGEAAPETPAATQAPAVTVPAETAPAAEGALKTGLAIVADLTDNTNATADGDGAASFNATIAAVTVDDTGVIRSCRLDSLGTVVNFDQTGTITSDLAAPVQTKNELGDAYGMKAYAGSRYEWYEQAAALASFAVGRSVEELVSGSVDETGYALDGTDLASSATIYLGGFITAIEKAVANARHLGARTGDELKLAIIPALKGSSAQAEEAGLAQLDCDVAAVTMNGDVITSCNIDSLQAKVNFTTSGEVTTEPAVTLPTKNELGEKYGMVAYAGAVAEWNEQAASFASYVTGKTLEEVKGIAVDEGTKPTDADLAASVTIAIGGFQALIAKAAQ